ncbi:UNVERIFIED_CONTAM: peptidogalycan biosysnthesis protein, partial [Prevotella sp. 15_C9]
YISFPTTAIPILAMPYPQALRKKNRKRYKKFKKDFDDNFYWTTVNDFGGEKAVEFYNLYKAVLNKAKNKFEFLNAKFFELLKELMGEHVFLL